jgi:hypothetical protein
MAGGGTKVSVSHEDRKPKQKKLHRISVERAKNGGHTVEHTFRSGPDVGYEQPVTHVFGKKDGGALMAHLKRHLGIQDGLGGGVADKPVGE